MQASEIVVNVLFYVFAAAAVAGAIGVAASRNIVRSAFALLAVLFSAAALYALMKADFIAAAQVLIYVGGILVLIMFAVMLTHRITDVHVSNDSTPGPAAFCACLCLLFALVVVILFTVKWKGGSDEVVARAGGDEAVLLQYQADGRTGLRRGGASFEDRVVVGVRPLRADGVVGVQVQVAQPEMKDELNPDKWDWKDAATEAPPALREGAWVATLKDLKEKRTRWRARLVKAGGASAGDWLSDGNIEPDFEVFRGVTRPAALALAGPYLFAFEVVSVLLLASLVGAAFLARKEVKE